MFYRYHYYDICLAGWAEVVPLTPFPVQGKTQWNKAEMLISLFAVFLFLSFFFVARPLDYSKGEYSLISQLRFTISQE